MKQEIKEALDKIFENLDLNLLKNGGSIVKTIFEFDGAEVDMQNLIHIKNEKLKLSESEKEEIDKYYSSKMVELMSKYFPY